MIEVSSMLGRISREHLKAATKIDLEKPHKLAAFRWGHFKWDERVEERGTGAGFKKKFCLVMPSREWSNCAFNFRPIFNWSGNAFAE